jgi:hypothetical protein
MRRYTSEQLPLPGSLDQEVILRDKIARLEEHLAALEKRCNDADQVKRNNAALHTRLAEVTKDRDRWRFTATTLQAALDMAQAPDTRPVPAPSTPWVASELKKLVTIAHPDRWEGKPATELAHEVTVALNQLRGRQGGSV